MILNLNVWSGLCNQLLPIVSCIYFCYKYNKKLIYNAEVLEVVEYKTNYYIYEFFIFPEICEKNNNLLDLNINYQIKLENTNNISSNDLINNNIYIKNCYWLFCLDNENNNFKPQPFMNIIKNEYLLNIQKILKNIKLIDILNEKIQETTKIFDNNIIGIHFRGADGGFKPNKNNIDKLENFILSLENKMIYLSCDCYEIELKIKKKFKNKIITMINPFGGDDSQKVCNNKNSVMNSICEMYILSKCNEIYGTRSSSFTFTAWLLSNSNKLQFWN